MSIQLFYAISSQNDCTSTCQNQPDCQAYKWDSTGNCYLYYLLGSDATATLVNNRIGKIPSIPNYQASQSNCISPNTCNVLKSNELYDFNKCIQLCNNDSNCQGFGTDNQQYCSFIEATSTNSNTTNNSFQGYTFLKATSTTSSISSSPNTLAIIISVICAVVIFLAIIIFIMIKRIKKPIKDDGNDYYDSHPSRPSLLINNRLSFASVEEPMLPNVPRAPSSQELTNHPQFKIANATYNDLWTSTASGSQSLSRSTMGERRGVSIPGIDTSVDYHLSKEQQGS